MFSRFKGILVVEWEVGWEGSERTLNTLQEVGRKYSPKKSRFSAASSFWMKAGNMSRTSRASAMTRAGVSHSYQWLGCSILYKGKNAP